MTLEALLSYAHILAILTMTVFLASEAALCRTEWLNAAVVERLAKIDMVYGASAIAVLPISAVKPAARSVFFMSLSLGGCPAHPGLNRKTRSPWVWNQAARAARP